MGRSTEATSSSSRRDAPRRARKEQKPDESNSETSEEVSDVLARTSLSLAGHALPPPSAVAQTLARFMQLRRLDVSDMQASEDAPAGLTDLHWLAKAERLSKKKAWDGALPLSQRLTWLSVAGNAELGARDDDLNGLELMEALHALRGLKALVLSHNHVSALPAAFPHLPELNTLALSNNELTQLPVTLPSSLPNLKKLSLGHNRLEKDGLPDFSVCSHLREVRLGGNETLRTLPAHLSAWGRGVDGGAPGLLLLDVSDCGLDTWEAVQPLLAMPQQTDRHGLANLGAKGNRIAEDPRYRETLCDALPALRILDNVRLIPKKSALPESEAANAAASDAKDESIASTGLQAQDSLPSHRESAPLTKAASKRAKTPVARAKREREDELAPSTAQDPFFVPRDNGPAAQAPAPSKRRNADRSPREQEAPEPKKPRKRSGRGPKRRPGALVQSHEEPKDPVPPPVTETPAPATPAPTKTKKTRRKKSTKTVELDMDVPVSASIKPAPSSARAPSPPPVERADTGVVQVVDVARPQRTTTSAATLLGRRNDEWGGW
ncbi:hypothetical protein MEQU1_001547 [Malassezia equina]|uniref:L domain-like protein n=1 Tax=Malassezia equina TaxID=1381935 RepID=A0AAF0J3C8_9BASI|nr:hypothetical protein MEQU1_001547 [Malassezia equina]